MSSKLARLQARIAELEADNARMLEHIGSFAEQRARMNQAVIRLTEERDAALEAMRGVSEAFVIADPGAAKFYLQALKEGQIPPSAVGGAPGVSETHTDPKEAPDELR